MTEKTSQESEANMEQLDGRVKELDEDNLLKHEIVRGLQARIDDLRMKL